MLTECLVDNFHICFFKGAAVVLTPAYCDPEITSPVTVNVVVTFGNGRDAKSSEPIEFTYKPKPKVNLQVEEVEMHPSLPIATTGNILTVDLFNPIGDQVMLNSLPQEIVEPVPVVLPTANEEQGELYCKSFGQSNFSTPDLFPDP